MALATQARWPADLMALLAVQDRPGSSQEPPGANQEPPRATQDRLKIPKERPKIAQERPKSPQERPKTTPRGPKSDPRAPSSESPLPRTTEKSPWVVLGDFGVVLEVASSCGPRHSHMLVPAPGGVPRGCGTVALQFTPRPTVGKGRPRPPQEASRSPQ